MKDFEKLEQSEIRITSQSKTVGWLDNYWYHYKWHTIIFIFVAALLIFMITQCMQVKKNDVVVTYCGPSSFLAAETEGMRDVLNRVMSDDFDGNGEKYTEFVIYTHYSEDELLEDQQKNEGHGTVNIGINNQQLKSFNDFMMTGECSVYFLSPYMYDHIQARNNLKKLSEVFDDIPASAYDEYAIRLGDTSLYQSEEALRLLPADTLVCLTVPYALGRSSQPEMYSRSVEMFRAIVSVAAP